MHLKRYMVNIAFEIDMHGYLMAWLICWMRCYEPSGKSIFWKISHLLSNNITAISNHNQSCVRVSGAWAALVNLQAQFHLFNKGGGGELVSWTFAKNAKSYAFFFLFFQKMSNANSFFIVFLAHFFFFFFFLLLCSQFFFSFLFLATKKKPKIGLGM